MKKYTVTDMVHGPFTVAPLAYRYGFSTHKVVNKIRETLEVGPLHVCERLAESLNDQYVVYVMAKGTAAEKLI